MQQNLPKHIVFILDGNRRWSKSHGLVPWSGHLNGKNKANEISEAAFTLGIPYVTLWVASEDNLRKRSAVEINFLVSLLKDELKSRMVNKLFENQTRLRILGGWETIIFDQELVRLIYDIESQTRLFDKYNLTILFGYDGKRELVEAIQKIIKNPNYNPSILDFETIRRAAWTGELPPVDLVIRTGEKDDGWFHNSSGFMMLHTADSEIHSSKTLWPDFSEQELKKILKEYGKRERKFGK